MSTKEFGRIRIPRNKKDREYLVANKLVGKIQLQSDMSEAQIFNEIRSVFRSPMGCDDEFSFTILQQSGGGINGSRALIFIQVDSGSCCW